VGASERRLQVGDAGMELGGLGAGGGRDCPGVLAVLAELLAPAVHDGLAEAVFAAELGHALLAGQQLANDLQLEVRIKDPFGHRSAPWTEGLIRPLTVLFDKGRVDYSDRCLIVGVQFKANPYDPEWEVYFE
jgi:hypothetical protein